MTAIPFFLSCRPAPEIYTVARTRVLLDTAVTIKIHLPDSSRQAEAGAAIQEAFAAIARLDSALSSHRNDSEVAALNRAGAQGGRFTLSADLDTVLAAALEVSHRSHGAFDITIAPVLALWHFGTDSAQVPAAEAIRARLAHVGYQHLRLTTAGPGGHAQVVFMQPGMAIDLGGLARGFAIDRGIQILRQRGFADVMVAAGGDVRVHTSGLTAGRQRIQIRHPRAPDRFFAHFKAGGGAMATCGDYERYLEQRGRRYHHLLDPQTGYPARAAGTRQQMLSATVVAPTAMFAEAYANAIFVLGPEAGIALAEQVERLEALVIYMEAGKLRWRATENFKKRLEEVAEE
ncbi:MAG: FAD:protein FMN transferase [candidate division KSB1 bacterium]|nr:FAD:protein FMN transferase [candidate division KSB1 bacterium]MDZ7273266.1 FAD:protein FMN transferase [candidate division KSB1 bacterium]MDZ7285368.1 FAD:protein FMN transferase [candidate division KSB1 bacterium]MDZ7298400.1 FAD:protein FMN transferase [candidate division KSB1 bacterium]MDZ7306478.1 FAD:protein FMN transferase [candidate division KSB1 bacterium]